MVLNVFDGGELELKSVHYARAPVIGNCCSYDVLHAILYVKAAGIRLSILYHRAVTC